MKTKGHKDIASFYALDAIVETAKRLPRSPMGEPNAQALLVGNWLTDVAQFIIPLFGVNRTVNSWLRGSIDMAFTVLYAILLEDDRGQLMVDEIVKSPHRGERGGETLRSILDEWEAHLSKEAESVLDGLRREFRGIGCDATVLDDAQMNDSDAALDLIDRARREACTRVLEQIAAAEGAPAAAREKLRQVENRLQPLFSRLSDLAVQLELIDLDDVQAKLETVRMDLHAAVDNLMPDDYERLGEIHQLIRSAVLLSGYFKFVHPEKRGGKPRLPYRVYARIVDQHLVASWTHMHLDRAVDPSGERLYHSAVSQGAETRHGLYDYLREDLSIIVSRLYEVERDWAIPFFVTGERRVSNDDAWHDGLAELGATMHAVQDFFAHTNFLEHAFRGDWDVRTSHLTERQQALLLKRLRRWVPTKRIGKRKTWQDFPEETHVVSGYFDCMDTLVVFAQGLFQFVGQRIEALESEDVDKVIAETRDKAERIVSDPFSEFLKQTREIVEIIEDPRKASEDITNETAQKYRESIEGYDIGKQLAPPERVDPDDVRDLVRDSWLFQGADRAELVEHVINVVQLFHYVLRARRLVLRYIQLAADVVRLIQFGVSLLRGPLLVLRDLPDAIAQELSDYFRKVMVHEAEHRFLHLIGAERIGSHSLLAKDEEASLLYREALQLAMFVDAYIISLLIRAPQENGPPAISPGIIEVTKWEEVIDHFLNHPYAGLEVVDTARETLIADFIIHVDKDRRPNSLRTLAQYFKTNAAIPADRKWSARQPWGYRRFDWKVIADANFPTWGLDDEQTKYVVNAVLSAPAAGHPLAGTGFRTRDGINFAFKTGTPVRIPFQKIEFSQRSVSYLQRNWWQAVLDLGDLREMRNQFRDWRNDVTQVPLGLAFNPAHHSFSVDTIDGWQAMTAFLDREVAKGTALRTRRAEEEVAIRQEGSFLACIFDSLTNRAIH